MEGLRPCPRCGSEVEVIKCKDTKTKKIYYRIQCYGCKYTVAKGFKYPEETDEEGKERIRQYHEYLENYYAKPEV